MIDPLGDVEGLINYWRDERRKHLRKVTRRMYRERKKSCAIVSFAWAVVLLIILTYCVMLTAGKS